MNYLLSHDLGTTGDKAVLVSERGDIAASAFCGYPTYYPRPGWAEQDPEGYWKAFCRTTREMVETSGVNIRSIAAVSFSAQMMAALPVGQNGRPLRKAIIWSDMRASEQTARIDRAVGSREVYRITGHRLSPAYSASKIMWIRDFEPEMYEQAEMFLQVKDYVVFRLTGEYRTDYSDATGTNLFDVHTMSWSEELLKAAGILKDKLPEAVPATTVVGGITGKAAALCGLAEGTPVVIGGGDGACATYGSGILDAEEAYLCLGTSSWIATAVKEPVLDKEMRICSYALFEENAFMPTGSMNAGGGSLKWFLDSVLAGKERYSFEELLKWAGNVDPGVHGLLFLPYLMGERSPLWNHNARGSFIGLSMKHTKEEMVRAILEGVVFHIKSIYDVFEENNIRPEKIRIIGGGARSPLWCSIIADVLGKDVVRLNVVDEATSMGAAVAGGVGTGVFSSFSDACTAIRVVEETSPEKEHSPVYSRQYRIFREAYRQLESIFEMLGS